MPTLRVEILSPNLSSHCSEFITPKYVVGESISEKEWRGFSVDIHLFLAMAELGQRFIVSSVACP